MKNIICLSIISLFVLIISQGCESSREGIDILSQTEGMGTNNPESGSYVIKTRDQIRITFSEYPEFDTTATVSETGSIYIRLIGEINAVGLTKAQLIKDLSSKVSLYVKGKTTIDISIVNKEVQNITVIGSVSRQGVYATPPDGSLLGAIALAGGATGESDLRHVKIFRRGNYAHPIEVDVSVTLNTIDGTNEQPLPLVGSGDTVYIPKMENFVRTLSEFLRDSFVLYTVISLF